MRIGCPVNCSYCPQSTLIKADHGNKKLFEIEDFCQVLDNATEYEHPVEVYFAGFSEPLAVKNWQKFIAVCEDANLVYRFVLFTTGYRLSEDQMKFLSSCKKLQVNFHIGSRENMPNYDDTFLEKIELVKKYLPNSKFFQVGFSPEEFHEINLKLQANNIEYQFQEIICRAGNLKTVNLLPLNIKNKNFAVTCNKMNDRKRPVILPDGTALACTNDYGCEMKIGNLMRQKWSDLDFEKIRRLQSDHHSGLPCFRDCHFAKKTS